MKPEGNAPYITWLEETPSTNVTLAEMLRANRPPEGSVLIARSQTAGRGIDTNSWESEPGKNLTFSMVLYPQFLPVDEQFLLTEAVSLGILKVVSRLLPGMKTAIKWPNDIYAGDKKLCGILIQNSVIGDRFEYAVVGVGVNVNQEVFRSDAPNPVSLCRLTGDTYDLHQLLMDITQSVMSHYEAMEVHPQKTKAEYLAHLYRMKEWHPYEIAGKAVTAMITGTSTYGELMLEGRDGTPYRCGLKEVKFIRDQALKS